MRQRRYEEYEWALGRLDDGEADVSRILGRRSGFSSARPAVFALPSVAPKRLAREGRTPFHLHHGKPVVKAPEVPRRGLAESRNKYPNREYVTITGKGGRQSAIEAGGKYDRSARCWWIPSGSSLGAGLKAASGITGGRRPGRVLRSGAARAFQRYIDRGDPSVSEEVDRDSEGAIAIGNIAPGPEERLRFWSEVERSVRPGGRVQMRLDMEFPHQLDAPARRRVLQRFVDEFEARGLPVWGVVHKPEVQHGTDRRNYHAHVVYLDRPCRRVEHGQWDFAETKDREAQGPAWVKLLRQRWGEAVNRELDAQEVPLRFFPGSYADLEIDRQPAVHLGPRITAMERTGLPTGIGVANAMIESHHSQAEMWADRAERIGGIEWSKVQTERVLSSDQAWPELRRKAQLLAGAIGEAERAAIDAAEDAETVRSKAELADVAGEWVYAGWATSERDLARRAVIRQMWARREREKLGSGSSQRGYLDELELEAKAAETNIREAARAIGLRRAEPGLGGDATETALDVAFEKVLVAWRALRDEAERKRLAEIEQEERRIAAVLRLPRFGRPLTAGEAPETEIVEAWRGRLRDALASWRAAETANEEAVGKADSVLIGINTIARAGNYDLDQSARWAVTTEERQNLEARLIASRSRALRLAGDLDAPGDRALPEEREILQKEQQRLVLARKVIAESLRSPPSISGARAIPAENIAKAVPKSDSRRGTEL